MGHGAMQTVKLPIVQSYDRQAESEMWKACYSSADLKRKQQSTGTVVDGFTSPEQNLSLEQSRKLKDREKDINKFGKVPLLATRCTKMMFSKFGSIVGNMMNTGVT